MVGDANGDTEGYQQLFQRDSWNGTGGALRSTHLDEVPPEARQTLALIKPGGPFPFRKDGDVFGNRVAGVLVEQRRQRHRVQRDDLSGEGRCGRPPDAASGGPSGT